MEISEEKLKKLVRDVNNIESYRAIIIAALDDLSADLLIQGELITGVLEKLTELAK